jgi:hypothetical protein
MGIVSTPVIDQASGTIYLVARTKEFGTTFVQKIHALDIQTGQERPYSPTTITATYPAMAAWAASSPLTPPAKINVPD